MLGGFDYASNETVLHTDGSLLPQRGRRPRLVELPAGGLLDAATPMVDVTYHLNRLQAL